MAKHSRTRGMPMGGRGYTRREGQTQIWAFNIYRDLGHNRSYMETAKRVGVSANTIASWAKRFEWRRKLDEHRADLMEREAKGAFLELKDPVLDKVRGLIEEVESLIDTVFEPDVTGRKVAKIKITTAKDLIDLVDEYRRILESYYSFLSVNSPKKDKPTGNQVTVFMGDMSQEERIKLLQGVASANGNVARGNTRAEGKPADADYTDVSE